MRSKLVYSFFIRIYLGYLDKFIITMDFSTPTRALQSLGRRRPSLPTEIVDTSRDLLDSGCLIDDPTKYLNGIKTLLYAKTPEARARWEGLAVGILLATQLLDNDNAKNSVVRSDNSTADAPNAIIHGGGGIEEKVYIDGPRVPTASVMSSSSSNEAKEPDTAPGLEASQLLQVATWLYEIALIHLEHDEPRIRTLVAKSVGAHVSWSLRQDLTNGDGTARKQRFEIQATLIKSIDQHIVQGRDEKDDKFSKSSTGALDDTTGWRALETNWQCLACCVASMGSRFLDEEAQTDAANSPFRTLLKHCEYSAVTHLNRHVRAAGIAVLEQLVSAAGCDPAHYGLLLEGTSPLRTTVVSTLKSGLGDNWSQVRMAASVLNRVFWTTLIEKVHAPEDNLQQLYPTLIPRMCMNRFYLAQGVKLYSHETWCLVFAESGRGLDVVCRTIAPICRYYTKMCDADNHVVREAACQAVAELAVKLGMSEEEHREALQPHVQLLLQALLMCFCDESWPVRDEACLACGTFCRAYPEECRPELELLWQRWTEQLTDQIWSVRADAAAALADAMRAYGRPFQDRLLVLINDLLPSAKNQPKMTMEEYKAFQNNTEAHTNSQLYSCGSLAPKLRKSGAGRIGCSSCDVNRAKQPWEATDGCLYLLREMIDACQEAGTDAGDPAALRPMGDDLLLPLMTKVADVCRVSHFPQGDDLRATLWRQLPGMAHALGKVRMKRLYLEIFLDLLMRNMESSTASAISKHAAGSCAYELSQLVGPSIFLGRIMDDRQRDIAQDVLREREQEERIRNSGALPHFHPQMQAHNPFSPFEPPGLLDNVGKRKNIQGLQSAPGATAIHPAIAAKMGANVKSQMPGADNKAMHPGVGDSFAL